MLMQSEARANARTNMFLAAVAAGSGFMVPVKIRNMSSTGALLEGPGMPESGTSIRLLRGRLVAPAYVVWSYGGRCGIRFKLLLSVTEWMAPPSNREQQRIDDAIRLLKAGAIPLGVPQPEVAEEEGQLGRDLHAVHRLLDAHGDSIACDAAYVQRFGEQLQNLDIALQMVATIADVLVCGEEARAMSRLQNLRASCREAVDRLGS
jgi:hypothetical protein